MCGETERCLQRRSWQLTISLAYSETSQRLGFRRSDNLEVGVCECACGVHTLCSLSRVHLFVAPMNCNSPGSRLILSLHTIVVEGRRLSGIPKFINCAKNCFAVCTVVMTMGSSLQLFFFKSMCMWAKSLSHVQLFCDPMDCYPPGSSVHGISQARMLNELPYPSPGDLPNPGVELMPPAALQVDSLLLSQWEVL